MKFTNFSSDSGFRSVRRGIGVAFLWLALAVVGSGATGRLLILHTNDMHDNVRPGAHGLGGLPYISGYVKQVRAERDDVLLVDGGDVVEKGDLVAYLTMGEITYEALGRIGYDAVTIGNHDHNFGFWDMRRYADRVPKDQKSGFGQLRRYEELMGRPFICLNLVDEDGSPVFTPSRVIEVNGVKVGLIGMVVPRKPEEGGIDFEASGRALAREAERLKREVHLVVAVCHESTRGCERWARMAPAVDVFVAGHNHEALFEPVVVQETGAIIVQAGSNARWVGRLELEVDLAAKRVIDHQGELVLMRHDLIPPDEEMIAWVRRREAEICPQASDFVVHVEQPVGWFGLGRLSADAVRWRGGADVGFFHATQVVRNALAAGPADYNAIFRTGGDRGNPLVRTELSGAEISAYMNGLMLTGWGQTQWAGFSVRVRGAGTDQIVYETDLDPDRVYSVIMSDREWETRFLRMVDGLREAGDEGVLTRREFHYEKVDFTFTDAVVPYIREFAAAGEQLHERLAKLRKAQGDADPNEARLEPRYLRSVDYEVYFQMPPAAAPGGGGG